MLIWDNFNLLNNIWWPWLNVFNLSFFLQLSILYSLYLIFFSKNIYYVIFYFFLLIFYFGIFLCLYQVELFTGFLWLAECIIIFCLLLLLFYLNTSGNWNKLLINLRIYIFIGFLLAFFCLCFGYHFTNTVELETDVFFNNWSIWDDYYEAFINSNANDFIAFLISYYTLNSYFLLIIAFLILIGSLICIQMYKLIKINKINAFSNLFNYYHFFKNNMSFNFIRQQNLHIQEKQISSTRIFKKKK